MSENHFLRLHVPPCSKGHDIPKGHKPWRISKSKGFHKQDSSDYPAVYVKNFSGSVSTTHYTFTWLPFHSFCLVWSHNSVPETKAYMRLAACTTPRWITLSIAVGIMGSSPPSGLLPDTLPFWNICRKYFIHIPKRVWKILSIRMYLKGHAIPKGHNMGMIFQTRSRPDISFLSCLLLLSNKAIVFYAQHFAWKCYAKISLPERHSMYKSSHNMKLHRIYKISALHVILP